MSSDLLRVRLPVALLTVPVLLALLACAVPAFAQSTGAHSPLLTSQDVISKQVVVGYGTTDPVKQAAVRAVVGGIHARKLGSLTQEVMTVANADESTYATLRAQAEVRYAEPNYRTKIAYVPPNAGFAAQWGIQNTGRDGGLAAADMDLARAWDIVPGGHASIKVGLADSGLLFGHPQLGATSIYRNTGEMGVDQAGRSKATNGLDDDANGCVDDANGCDEIDDDRDPTDKQGHGTGVAGIFLGDWGGDTYAGVAPKSTVMVGQIVDNDGNGTTAALTAGLNRLANDGARVVNVSVGGPASIAVNEAIASHPDTLYVAAAGNAGADLDAGASHMSPCEAPNDNVICVAATNRRDEHAGFSNWGTTAVDVSAPGVAIPSLTLTGTTRGWNGTSFAAPQVTGIAALMLAAKPGVGAIELKRAIMESVDKVPGLETRTSTGGRVNAYRALAAILGMPAAARPVAAPAAAAPVPAAPTVAVTVAPVTTPAAGTTVTTTAAKPKAKTVKKDAEDATRQDTAGDGGGTAGARTTSGTTAPKGASAVTAVKARGLRITARRGGRRSVLLTVTCGEDGGCTERLALTAKGGRRVTVRLALRDGRRRTIGLRVAAAAKVKTVALVLGTGTSAVRRSVKVTAGG